MVVTTIFELAQKKLQSPALTSTDLTWNYADLAHRILDAEYLLKSLDLPASGRVGVAITDLRAAWIFILALEKMGHTATALPTQCKAADLKLAGVVAWITDDCVPVSWIERTIQIDPDFAVKPIGNWDLATPFNPPTHENRFILYSSGTTGTYKKIVSVGSRRDARARVAIDQGRELPNRRHYLGAFGPWTAHGYIQPIHAWTAGGHVVFEQRLEPWRAILAHKPTDFFMTPGVAKQFLVSLPTTFPRQPNMKVTISGGALTKSLLSALQTRVTDNIQQVFASTEAGLVARTQIKTVADLEEHLLAPNAQVQVVDELDNVVADGAHGILRMKTPFMSSSYFEDPEATAESFRDGWFYSGDLGVITGAGKFKLTGRASEIINFHGDKIAPHVLEDRIKMSLNCDDVAMVSVSATAADDALHIFLVNKAPITREALAAAIAPIQSAFSRVSFHSVPTLPRTTTGKVRYRELRETYIN